MTAPTSTSSPAPAPAQKTSAPPSTFSWPFNPESPLFVAKAIVASVAAGSASGASIGVVRGLDPYRLSINMGINGGVVSLTFFGLREYLITPLLLSLSPTTSHLRQLALLAPTTLTPTHHTHLARIPPAPSMTELRTERLLDSALAGGATGALLTGSLRRHRSIVPATITAAGVAVMLQYAVNEVRVVRLKVLRRAERKSVDVDETQRERVESETRGERRAGTRTNPTSAPLASVSPSPSPSQASPPGQVPHRPFDQLRSETTPKTEATALPSRIMNAMSRVLPVRKLSDAEYLDKLEHREKEINARIEAIQAEEVRLYEAGQSGKT